MSEKETKLKINNLVQKLHELRLQREEISQEEDRIQTELLFLSSEHETEAQLDSNTVSVANPKLRTKVSRKDRQGNVIDIGDTVKFLTPTKFEGKQGVVTNFSPSRVTSVTNSKCKVSKASHNLSILKKKDNTI